MTTPTEKPARDESATLGTEKKENEKRYIGEKHTYRAKGEVSDRASYGLGLQKAC